MVESRLKGEAASFLVGKFWAPTATGELDPMVLQNGEGILGNGIARVGETDRGWDAVRLAPFIERPDLLGEVRDGFVCDRLVVPRVVAYLVCRLLLEKKNNICSAPRTETTSLARGA